MTNTKILLPFFIFLTLLTIFSLNIPFFWDSTFFSTTSVHFYNNGLNRFIAPLKYDTGGFPLYSAYLTMAWKFFGKTLTVSHLAMLPFLFGVLIEFFKLAKRYLNQRTIVFALILLIIHPVFITQSILMGYDIIILYFFLLSLNALYNNRTILYSIALIFLCLISIRGIMLASVLFIFDIILNKRIDFKLLRNYFPSIIILLIWAIYHKAQTDWYLFSPIREDNHEQFSGVMMLRQFIYVLWKNIDLGGIVLWIIFLFSSFYFFKKTKSPEHKELLRSVLISFFVLTTFMILIKNPIGHKYFLVVFVLLILAVCYFIQQIEKQKVRMTLFTLITVCLIAGNFILYPQRYGNAWDSSLKVIPYFPLEHKMRVYLKIKHIAPESIGTQFPLTNDFHNSTLANNPDNPYADIETNSINNFSYFLYSNIINTNRIEELEEIKKTWVVEKEIKSGMVELILYKNPNY